MEYFNSYVSRFWEVSLHMFIFVEVGSGDCTISCGGLGTALFYVVAWGLHVLRQLFSMLMQLWTKGNVECVFTEYINTMATKYRPSLTRAHKDKFLKLEDITHQFKQPAIMDVKIGKRVWDDYAEQDKVERERKKYPDQEVIGFRIIGMRVSLYSTTTIPSSPSSPPFHHHPHNITIPSSPSYHHSIITLIPPPSHHPHSITIPSTPSYHHHSIITLIPPPFHHHPHTTAIPSSPSYPTIPSSPSYHHHSIITLIPPPFHHHLHTITITSCHQHTLHLFQTVKLIPWQHHGNSTFNFWQKA